MVVGDLNKVWEVKALKRKPNEEQARNFLEKIAKQVQPIMQKHNWRVKLLSEFCPNNPSLLGLNVGGGVNVKLRLRSPNNDSEFYPYDMVLDTMLHELCHNKHGPHNAAFYQLWDELRKECEELMSKGITGTGGGFDLPGKRLGGISRQPPLSSLRKIALAAAEKRGRIQSLLPSGPKRLGGDSTKMTGISPIQAAAMAAERRAQDYIWCGSHCFEITEGESSSGTKVSFDKGSADVPDRETVPRKRSRGSPHQSFNSHGDEDVKILNTGVLTSVSKRNHAAASQKPKRTSDYQAEQTPRCESEVTYLGIKTNQAAAIAAERRARQSSNSLGVVGIKNEPNGVSSSGSTHIGANGSQKPSPISDDQAKQTSRWQSESTYLGTKTNSLVSTPAYHPKPIPIIADSDTWECGVCTLLNPELALICKVCCSDKPKDGTVKYKTWSCKLCTLDNNVEFEKCLACGQWRYSYGQPISTPTPYLGT